MHTAIEMFTDNEVGAKEVESFINHPINAIVIQHDARTSMNKHLAWGIEARLDNNLNEVRVIRVIGLCGGAESDMT